MGDLHEKLRRCTQAATSRKRAVQRSIWTLSQCWPTAESHSERLRLMTVILCLKIGDQIQMLENRKRHVRRKTVRLAFSSLPTSFIKGCTENDIAAFISLVFAFSSSSACEMANGVQIQSRPTAFACFFLILLSVILHNPQLKCEHDRSSAQRMVFVEEKMIAKVITRGHSALSI